MKQTAVEWLINELEEHHVFHDIKNTVAFQQAKAMEKEQLCQMYIQGRKDNHLDYYPEKHAKETYNETFKQE